MPSSTRYIFLLPLLCLPLLSQAVTLHRCEAPNGSTTFTTLSCSDGESLSLQDVRNLTPGSAPALMPEVEPSERTKAKLKKRELTIVGQPEDKCGNLINAKQRREAIINQRIIAGMSQQDVESALGKPDKVSIRNSSTSYRYDTKRGRSAQIEFDEKGCTRGKAKPQTAKSPR